MPCSAPEIPSPPSLCARVGGGSFTLPDVLQGRYGVVLLLPGQLVPVLQRPAPCLPARRRQPGRGRGSAVVALSVDDETTTAELIAKHGLTFPVGHSADATAISAATGAFVDPARRVPPVDRVRARPRRAGRRQRLLLRRHRAAGSRGRRRADPLPERPTPSTA